MSFFAIEPEEKIHLEIAIIGRTKQDAENMLKLINSYDRTENNIFQKRISRHIVLTKDGTRYLALSSSECSANSHRAYVCDQVIYDPYILQSRAYNKTSVEIKREIDAITDKIDYMVRHSRIPDEFKELKIQAWKW